MGKCCGPYDFITFRGKCHFGPPYSTRPTRCRMKKYDSGILKQMIHHLKALMKTVGCPENALSSQTEKFIWATAFSHYLGLKYIRTTKILKIHAFFHPNQSVQSFTIYMLKIPGTQLHNMTH